MSSSTNSTTCGSFLFTSISVESNPTQVGNICPDTIINYLVASVILASTIFFFTSSLIMLIIYGWRNKQNAKHQAERLLYVRARNPIIMSINLFTSAGIATFHTIRYLVGRKIFPCSLLGLSYFLIPPVIFLPTLLRSSRLFNMARINSLITATRQRKTFSLDQRNGKSTNMLEHAFSNVISSPSILSEEGSSPNNASTVVTTDNNDSSNCTTPRLTEIIARKVEFKIDTENNTSTTEQTEGALSDTESDVGSLYDADTTITKSVINQLKILNVLISNKFIFILYFTVLSCHVLLWLLLGGIEEGIYQSNPSQSRIFAGFLNFTSGCVVNTNAVIVIVCQAVLYLIAEVILLILCIISKRDTYYIKLETFIVVGMQVGVTLIFGLSNITAINRNTEYFYAGGNIIATFALLELFVSNFLPLVLSYYYDRKVMSMRRRSSFAPSVTSMEPQPGVIADEENQIPTRRESIYDVSEFASTSSIIILLRHRKYSEQFLIYAQRSYCPENILCWRDIEAYKKVKKDASRRRIGQFIFTTYIKHHSPLELNISKDDAKIQDIEQALSNKSLPLSASLFDSLQLLCLLNMIDIFERIKSNNKEIREFLKGVNNTTSTTVVL